MKCQVSSKTTHDVLISKEIRYKSFKEICNGEKKKVNLGFNLDLDFMKVENNKLMPVPQSCGMSEGDDDSCIHGDASKMSQDWEVLSKFLSTHNLEPNWLDCNMTWGWYDEDLGEWTGCMGKVCGTENCI